MANIQCSWASLLLATLFLFNSCSSSSDEEQSEKDVIVPIEKSVVTPVETHRIAIENMKFVPDSVVVNKGDKIVFINNDMVNHCVTDLGGKGWTSGILEAGKSWQFVVEENSNYYCALHKVMKGKIIIK